MTEDHHPLTENLLVWYREHARDLPWRAAPEPYAVWLSEVILQQTRVDQGTAYWQRFIAAFPTVVDLAAASTEEVMALWKGLGYYSRARNLHRAAQCVVDERGGQLPVRAEDWARLPGIGPYTAAAIASICFGEPIAVIDGNVQRVLSRLFDISDPVDRKTGRDAIQIASGELVAQSCPGESNQAWMELGALVCTPRNPKCPECPLADACLAQKRNTVLERPVKQPKKAPEKTEVLFRIHLRTGQSQQPEWWVETRPEKGIWAQLESFPCSMSPESGSIRSGFGPVRHLLTHKHMTAWFMLDSAEPVQRAGGRWISVSDGEANWPRIIDKVLLDLREWIVKN